MVSCLIGKDKTTLSVLNAGAFAERYNGGNSLAQHIGSIYWRQATQLCHVDDRLNTGRDAGSIKPVAFIDKIAVFYSASDILIRFPRLITDGKRNLHTELYQSLSSSCLDSSLKIVVRICAVSDRNFVCDVETVTYGRTGHSNELIVLDSEQFATYTIDAVLVSIHIAIIIFFWEVVETGRTKRTPINATFSIIAEPYT